MLDRGPGLAGNGVDDVLPTDVRMVGPPVQPVDAHVNQSLVLRQG